jgi:hypothetical protein
LFNNDVEKIDISESDLELLNAYTLEKSSGDEQRNAVVDEILLKYFAMAVAKSLKHPEICKIIKTKAGEKFDGDYDVLWGQIKNTRISGQEMREMVNSRFSDRTRQVLTMEIIEEVPLLQVSLPVNFDDWDGKSAILVAYTPLTTDDMEWEEIIAYDADLKEHILDAKTEPDFPVMVIGINERIEYNKTTLAKTGEKILAKTTTIRQSEETLDSIRIAIDGEGWPNGDPEIYIVAAGTNSTYDRRERVNLASVNKNNKWYTIDGVLFSWETEYWGTHTGYGVLEYDPDGYNYSVTILSEDVEVKVKEKSDGNDEFIGNIYSIPFNHTSGAIWLLDDAKIGLSY